MKIAIHVEPNGGSIGGAELSVATLAHALAADHDVTLLHHRRTLTGDELGAFASLDLSRVDTRYVPPPLSSALSSTHSNPFARYREASAWQEGLSQGFDLFITFTHGIPPFCHAKAGILVVLFPLFRRPTEWPWRDAGPTPSWKRLTRRAYYDWEWRRRIDSYDRTVSISAFTREWTRRWWNTGSTIVHPPVDIAFDPLPKRDLILSVGRFATAGLSKKQRETVQVFRQLHQQLPSWRYVCAGALGSAEADRDYYNSVVTAAQGSSEVCANLPRTVLRQRFAEAKIFWHAAGFGDAVAEQPELSEHFGMATVEAMAAGCVPIVINTGGQREIITHGVDGFLWDSLDDLARLTRELAHDERLRERISAQARARAQNFSTETFLRQICTIVQSLRIDDGTTPACRTDAR